MTRLTSTVTGIGTSITARAQPRDRFVVCTMWPFGVMTTSPAGVRTVVVRRLTSSTVPITGAPMPATAIRIRSP